MTSPLTPTQKFSENICQRAPAERRRHRAPLAVPRPRRATGRPPARRPQRPCFGAARTAAAPRRRTSRPAKRNESARDTTPSGAPAAMTSRRRRTSGCVAAPWEGRASRHHHDRGRGRRPLPLELGAASVLSGKGTSLAGVVACVASRPPRRAASGEQRRCRAGVEDGGEEVMGDCISFPDPSRVSVCS